MRRQTFPSAGLRASLSQHAWACKLPSTQPSFLECGKDPSTLGCASVPAHTTFILDCGKDPAPTLLPPLAVSGAGACVCAALGDRRVCGVCGALGVCVSVCVCVSASVFILTPCVGHGGSRGDAAGSTRPASGRAPPDILAQLCPSLLGSPMRVPPDTWFLREGHPVIDPLHKESLVAQENLHPSIPHRARASV